ncbi:hypothetical protein UlMin_031409 [Ulmus minor]
MRSTEGESSSEIEIRTAGNSLDGSVIFHTINDIAAFVLFMHQQIPHILQDISVRFDELRTEHDELALGLKQTIEKASERRKQVSQMREVKQGIRRFEKLMRSVSDFRNALELIINEVPNIPEATLVLGSTPIRPQQVYEMSFSHGNCLPIGAQDFTKSKRAQTLSKQAILGLINAQAGSVSYPGACKLFLLVKAPSSLNLPLHFLPKRDFRYNKKIVPYRVRFKCRMHDHRETDAFDLASHTDDSIGLVQSTSNDMVWFQCRHVIKGIAIKRTEE